MKNRRLGRGLDFLLTSPAREPESATSRELDLREISSNPWQPRTTFDEKALDELARSIRKVGVVQPILVRPKKGGFEVIAGERRLLAAKRAGLKKIQAVIREAEDGEMLTLALVENIQRRDLDPVERARAFQRLAQEQKLSHQKIADMAGLARPTVSNSLRLLELDEEMLRAIEKGKLTEGHARTLLAETDPKSRRKLFQELIEDNISVRKAENKVSKSPKKGARSGRGRGSPEARLLEEKLSEVLELPVHIQEEGERGRVVIRYRTLDEFDGFFEQITGEKPDL